MSDNMTTPAEIPSTATAQLQQQLLDKADALDINSHPEIRQVVETIIDVQKDIAVTVVRIDRTVASIEAREAAAGITATNSGYNTRAQDAQIERNIIAAAATTLKNATVQRVLGVLIMVVGIPMLNQCAAVKNAETNNPALKTQVDRMEKQLQDFVSARTNLTAVKP